MEPKANLSKIRVDTYFHDSTHAQFENAHARKQELRNEGYRVKVVKNTYGEFDVLKKHIKLIDCKGS
jgi:hypothetical protein